MSWAESLHVTYQIHLDGSFKILLDHGEFGGGQYFKRLYFMFFNITVKPRTSISQDVCTEIVTFLHYLNTTPGLAVA